MESNYNDYKIQVEEILDFGNHQLSTIKPSEWAEKYRSMDSSLSRFQGPFSYSVTPYTREIVDCLDPNHPARVISVMKGAQIGFSAGVIENGVGWVISQQPGNILFLTGHSDLAEEAVTKIDNMIDSCNIRHLIRPNIKRKRSMKTGDTNSKKEFPGGSLVSGYAGNHKLLRQRMAKIGFIDDFDAAKNSTKQSGSTREMIESRFASNYDIMKLFYISTPELKQTSNIEPVYEMGDQRKFFIPCPCCGEFINLEWNIPIENSEKEMGGITWKLDETNKLIPGSVGYICQKCGDFFNDSNKHELNLQGEWKPTAIPITEGHYSYHISSLYAPPGMYDWEYYVGKYLNANPIGGKQKEELQKTFVNLCLGLPFESTGEAPKANDLQKNIRTYEIGLIPEKVSERDGNGKIVLLTLAADLGGFENDARLDYEIVAWSETGASYSIDHGSIGTFIPKENSKKFKEDRERWTYELNRLNSVWKKFDEIIERIYTTDTGRRMKIFWTGIDTGHFTTLAYAFIDKKNTPTVCALKGDKDNKYRRFGLDTAKFKHGKERSNLYLIDVNLVKDELAEIMKLKWDEGNDENQPPMFMNYPQPSGGKYLFKNFFSHYEAEHRVVESKDGEGIASKWEKKPSNPQNHFWDVRVYNIAIKEIFTSFVCKQLQIKNYSWQDYVNTLVKKK